MPALSLSLLAAVSRAIAAAPACIACMPEADPSRCEGLLWALQIEARKSAQPWQWSAATAPEVCPDQQPVLRVDADAVVLDGLDGAVSRAYTLPEGDDTPWPRAISQSVLRDLGPAEAPVLELLSDDPIAFAPPPAPVASVPVAVSPVRALVRFGVGYTTTHRGLLLTGPAGSLGVSAWEGRAQVSFSAARLDGVPKGISGVEYGSAREVGGSAYLGGRLGPVWLRGGLSATVQNRIIGHDIDLHGTVQEEPDRFVALAPEPMVALPIGQIAELEAVLSPRITLGRETDEEGLVQKASLWAAGRVGVTLLF